MRKSTLVYWSAVAFLAVVPVALLWFHTLAQPPRVAGWAIGCVRLMAMPVIAFADMLAGILRHVSAGHEIPLGFGVLFSFSTPVYYGVLLVPSWGILRRLERQPSSPESSFVPMYVFAALQGLLLIGHFVAQSCMSPVL